MLKWMLSLLTGGTAAGKLIEIGSCLAEDVVVLEVSGGVVRPADGRSDVDVDVDGDTVRRAHTLGQACLDVRHRERVRLLRSERVRVVHHSPRRTTHCTAKQRSPRPLNLFDKNRKHLSVPRSARNRRSSLLSSAL